MSRPLRSTWTQLLDSALIAQCAVDTYRASGPGGQHRNKTSSAVRLRHEPSGMMVIAEESRSQHENKATAIKRLRRAFYLEWRDELDGDALKPEAVALHPDYAEAREPSGRLHLSAKNARFWPAVGVVLDVLNAVQGRVSEAAECLGISTGNLIDFLQVDDKVWQAANVIRARHGQKPLRPT